MGKKYPAWQYETSSLLGRNLHVLTKVNDTYYDVFYFALTNGSYGKHLPDVQKLIDSIEFFPVQKPVARIPSFMTANDTKGFSSIQNESATSNTLLILSHNSYISSTGSMHIVGEVRNDSPSTAEGRANLMFSRLTMTGLSPQRSIR